MDISVIIPYCNEYPQVLFTIQNIAQELRDRCDFEIIAVDNYCDEVEVSGYPNDKGGSVVTASVGVNTWLTSLQYKKKLSHWQAKNLAVSRSTGDYLFFVDAHCIVGRDSLFYMMDHYDSAYRQGYRGSYHLPLTYKILESRQLRYKLVVNLDKGEFAYSFTQHVNTGDVVNPVTVPCMSTCGMMIARELFLELGGFPKELGIYSGGEHFMNFTMAVLGYEKRVMMLPPLFHHGEKRGYSYRYDDMVRNRLIAVYIFGGEKWLEVAARNTKGNQEVIQGIKRNVLETCADHRNLIRGKQVIQIEEWVKKWIG